MNNLVLVVLDSARFDLLKAARCAQMLRLGKLERRYSYASWTQPSHQALVMGLLPHKSERRIFSSKVYAREMIGWKSRLQLPKLKFVDFVPHLNLPITLKKYGYKTHAIVSLPVLNPATGLGKFFDSYELMPVHNDFRGIVRKLRFSQKNPKFYLLNVGETHFPYSLCGEPSKFPRVSGLNGVLRKLDKELKRGSPSLLSPKRFFTAKQLELLKQRQVRSLRFLDSCMEDLYRKCPPNTWIIVTSDHGELFGEGGYFGHGPILHRKVFEVPFIEGMVPQRDPRPLSSRTSI